MLKHIHSWIKGKTLLEGRYIPDRSVRFDSDDDEAVDSASNKNTANTDSGDKKSDGSFLRPFIE